MIYGLVCKNKIYCPLKMSPYDLSLDLLLHSLRAGHPGAPPTGQVYQKRRGDVRHDNALQGIHEAHESKSPQTVQALFRRGYGKFRLGAGTGLRRKARVRNVLSKGPEDAEEALCLKSAKAARTLSETAAKHQAQMEAAMNKAAM